MDEATNRALRAVKLIEVLDAVNADVDYVTSMSTAMWEQVALAAGITFPSVKTRYVVERVFQERERRPNPLIGIPGDQA